MCRKDLDNTGHTGANLIDLSKTLNAIKHERLIAKLHAYGFNKDSLKTLFIYFKLCTRSLTKN